MIKTHFATLEELIVKQVEFGIAFSRYCDADNSLSHADLRDADLRDADLSHADLRDADLRDADLRYANLSGADLRDANLEGADLRDANLEGAYLRRANLEGAYLRRAYLEGAYLRRADLSGADLRDANLSGANLSGANLSGAKGLLSASQYLENNFEFLPDGSMVVYKAFNRHYTAPDGWVIEPSATITETCNPCRTSDCASGINVAIRNYDDFGDGDLWKCIIKPQWLGGVVVPYHTDGKIRTEKLQLIEIVGD